MFLVLPRKPVEHFFKLWPILLILSILPLVGAALYVGQAEALYESRGTLWVSESGTTGQANLGLGADNQFATPSQRQAEALNQLMATESFALSVARRVGLLDGASDREVEWRTTDYLGRELTVLRGLRESVGVRSSGPNLMIVTARNRDPELARATADAATSLYLERVSDEATRKTDLAVSFYQQRLDGAKETLDALDREVTQYVAAHPLARTPGAPPVYDPTFERLQSSFSTQNQLVASLQKEYEVAQLDAATTEEGLKGRYSLLDAPSLPSVPVARNLSSLVLPLAAALAVGGGLSIAVLYVAIATDHGVRSSNDIVAAGGEVLALVPEFDSRRDQPWAFRRFVKRDARFARRLASQLMSVEKLERGA